MKIAIYYPWIHLTSGVERTILEIVKDKNNEFVIYTNHLDLKHTYPELRKFNIVELRRIPTRRNILDVVKASITILFQKIDLSKYDLLMVHSEGLGDLILFRNHSIPTINFCHTPLRPVFDKNYRLHARSRRSHIGKIFYNLFSIIFKNIDKYLWKKYKLVIFNSKETLRRAKDGGLLNNNISYSILNPGVTLHNKLDNIRYDKYFLYMGRITWTKNVELAILAFQRFESRMPNSKFKLIISGQLDTKSKDYYREIQSKVKSKNIVFQINPDDKDVTRLYKNCYVFLGTASNEDWGITPIEANSFCKPTICVNNGGFKESQINNVTGILVDPNPESFSIAMAKMASNMPLVKKIGANAYKNSLKYSWSKFNKKLNKLINEYI